MNNKEFDSMFDFSEHDVEGSSTAYDYLVELEDLKDTLNECYQNTNANRRIIGEQTDTLREYEIRMKQLNDQLKSKNQEINKLRHELKSKRRGVSAGPPPQNYNMPTAELEKEVKIFLNRCAANVNEYNRTGRFNNIDQSINKVREFFNILLEELNRLNSGNRDVMGVLQSLISLEVGFFEFRFYFKLLPFSTLL
jgi:septal ring factor EnvC (AmiA/AmiB activator)